MSANHNQSLERALNIVSDAADCGADMLKLQTYTTDTMTMNIKPEEFRINKDSSLWKGQSLFMSLLIFLVLTDTYFQVICLFPN